MPGADTKILWANHPTHHTHHTHQPINPSSQQTYPPTPPITFNHEGGVPQKSSESKKVLEWSPLLACQKKFKPSLGLDLIDSQSSCFIFQNINLPLFANKVLRLETVTNIGANS